MTHDDRLLSMPLTDAEFDELEAFLTSSAVPEDCMNLEMLDGYLTATISSPQMLMPSQWLPVIWGEDASHSGNAVFASVEQAQRVMELILRHWSSIGRTLHEMPTRFHPLLYFPPEEEVGADTPHEAEDWCQGYMMGVQLTEEDWAPLYNSQEASDWIFPIEALAFGHQEPEYAEWFDDSEKRDSLVDELPTAAVLIYRFWFERQQKTAPKRNETKRRSSKGAQKKHSRLH
ncbi:MAG: YecA family protein [Proteobacteria bacterium]|nr:YecA family protein [Pseudomonadota bacterium]